MRHEVVQSLLTASAAPNHEQATQAVTNAVELASLHGMLQTVASNGRDLIELIERGRVAVPS